MGLGASNGGVVDRALFIGSIIRGCEDWNDKASKIKEPQPYWQIPCPIGPK
jgi:hypothetical protein